MSDSGAATLVDSNVLLDIVTEDPNWAAWSSAALVRAKQVSKLSINPIVYAEISAGYARAEEVDRVLSEDDFSRLPLPYEAAFLAACAFAAYRRAGGARRSPLPDFYIGAHAAFLRIKLLTRDPRRYRTYFPALELITPKPS